MTFARLVRHRVTLAVGLAAVAGIAAFARSMAFGFVYDDHWTVEGTPLDLPLGKLVGALARGAGRDLHIPDETRPAMVMSVWIDRALFGAWSGGYHAHSLLLYGCVCALGTWACLALSGRLRVALVAGLFFALAPLHAEVACAINYREDLIAAIGVLAPLICLARRRRAPWGLEGLAVTCWGLGLLGKESAVAFVPVLALAMALLPAVRARVLARRTLVASLAAVFVAWALWRGVLLVHGDDIPRAHYAGILERLLATARFLVRLGVETLLPFRPSPEYAREPPASAIWLLPLGAWMAAMLVLARRRATRIVALGLAVIMLAALPSSPVFAPANEIADRYAFLGVLGAGLVYGWLASRVALRARTASRVAAYATGCLVLGLACQAAVAPWESDHTLWLEATLRAPSSPRAWVGLSYACRLDGDLDAADRAIDRAIALDPRFVSARVTRAYNLLARGDVEQARVELGTIHDLGGDRHRGVAKATRCVALPPDRAMVCIR
jgi:hypothetical protein